jgi:hypothetical protein
MPRRNQPRRKAEPPRRGADEAATEGGGARVFSGGERVEEWRGEEYSVRSVGGVGVQTSRSSQGSYRCPGCDQLLTGSVPHVVAWPRDDPDATDRRHWHTACWSARGRRQPGVERSRNAPRYS